MRAFLFLTVAMVALAKPATAADISKLQTWQGGPVPALELQSLDGKQHQITDYRGKVLVLNFWATWCAPCVKEMPSMESLAKRLSDQDFALLTVNFGEQPARIKPFLEKIGVNVTVLLDPDMRASRAWVKKGLPTTFIIDADQKIRYQVLGELSWDSPEVENRIRELLPTG
jgi:thiol-disulfide isomerase/thioredoxin